MVSGFRRWYGLKLVVRAPLAHDVTSNSEYLQVVADIERLLSFVSELVRLVPKGLSSKRRVLPGVFKNVYDRWRMERKVRQVVYER